MYHNILVPLDGSTFAEQAIPWAVDLARRSGGSVTLARVHVPLAPAFAQGLPPFDYEIEAGSRRGVADYVERVARPYEGHDPLVRGMALEGPVVTTLCDYVKEHEVDLVVLSTHGRGPLARFWLGSTADELIRKLSVPVFTMRPQEEPVRAPTMLKHVLVPLDGSELAEAALEPALALAGACKAEVTLFRVLTPSPASVATFSEFGGAFPDPVLLRRLQELDAEERREAERYLQGTAAQFAAAGIRVNTRIVTGEQAALSILAQVRELAADAIVLGSHGRGGLPRLLLGSVADKVLRGATVPVLICHAAAVGEKAEAPEPAMASAKH